MCYDISFTVSVRQLADYFPGLIFHDQLELDFAGSDHIMAHAYGLHPIIYQHREQKQLYCRAMEWGCIPFYVQDEKRFSRQRTTMLNARSERILDDPRSYWNKIRNRRCLIPVTGIYEHREISGWKKKVPYFIKVQDQPVFFIPGLYSVANLPDTETGEMLERFTFTLITRGANAVMQNIHNGGENSGRMPLFLPSELAMQWLNEDLDAEAYRSLLAYELPAEALAFHPVFTIRSPKARPDNLPKTAFYAWENLPELGHLNPGADPAIAG